jgi:hypothetical protein
MVQNDMHIRILWILRPVHAYIFWLTDGENYMFLGPHPQQPRDIESGI